MLANTAWVGMCIILFTNLNIINGVSSMVKCNCMHATEIQWHIVACDGKLSVQQLVYLAI